MHIFHFVKSQENINVRSKMARCDGNYGRKKAMFSGRMASNLSIKSNSMYMVNPLSNTFIIENKLIDGQTIILD